MENVMMRCRKSILVVSITALLIVSSILVGIILVDFGEEKTIDDEHTFPLTVGEKTYIVTVLSNYSSVPELSYWEEGKAVFVDFRGDREKSFCNITVPTELIGGKLSVIDKYYKMTEDYYIQTFNGTHNSIFFSFDHIAYVKHFEIRGTQGVTSELK